VLFAVAAKAERLRLAGNSEFKAGRLQEAMQQYSQAVQQLPSDALLYNNISLVQVKLGRVDEVRHGLVGALMNCKSISMMCALGTALPVAVVWPYVSGTVGCTCM
jgi:tetratricopeptide (TPR) repeat protein